MEYDENEAIKIIKKRLPEAERNLYDDDEFLNIIDIIWDYYEANGLLDIDVDEDEEIDSADICEYVKRMLRKDKGAKINPSLIPVIVEAELEYENTLEEDF